MFFYLCCKIYIYASGVKGGRMCPAEHLRIFMVPAGNIKQVHLVLCHPGNFDAVIQSQPHICQIVTGKTDLNGESGTHSLSDRIQSHHKKPGAVFQRAAKFIFSPVRDRGKELRKQPSVSRMYLNHVESAVFAQLRTCFI